MQTADIELDTDKLQVTARGEPVRLSRKQFALLACLMQHAGEPVSRPTLLERVFDYKFDPGTNLIDVHIANLRQKIDKTGLPSYIETVRGVGYRIRTAATDRTR